MTEVYLLVGLCSCPGESKISVYSTKDKAIEKFEAELVDDLIEFKEEILKESECDSEVQFAHHVRQCLSYSFYDKGTGFIWVTEVRKVRVN